MKPSLREVWRAQISADDYDAHMAAVGQAQANARLVERFIERWLTPPARILVAGAGTGQMFDYARREVFDGFALTCTDLSAGLLTRLEQRLAGRRLTNVTTVVDDLEQTQLGSPFDAAIVVLVLEHIEWRRGVASLARLEPGRCLVVIQQNPPNLPARTLPGSLAVLHETTPSLVDPEALEQEFAHHGYRLVSHDVADVPDGKQMLAYVFAL